MKIGVITITNTNRNPMPMYETQLMEVQGHSKVFTMVRPGLILSSM